MILEEVSESKMSEKEKDSEAIKQNISYKPIYYVKLNQLSKDFGKLFTPQQELSAEQAFWFRISSPIIESSNKPPVKVEVPSELPKVASSTTSYSNTHVLSPTGLKCSTRNCGSKPIGNKRNDRISQIPSRNMKNKVKAQPRKVNKNNHVVKPLCDVDVKNSLLNATSELICATCKKYIFDGVHDMCLLDFIENVNSHAKSAKKHKKQTIWKPTGHVFTEVGLKWKPFGRTFTLVGNACPLTRITSANIVPPKKTTSY
nr:hypothetical protein [Tanacetum cinerariifolium]